MKMKSESEVVSEPQRPHGLQPTRLLRPWDFPGKSTGVGCHCLGNAQTIKTSHLLVADAGIAGTMPGTKTLRKSTFTEMLPYIRLVLTPCTENFVISCKPYNIHLLVAIIFI